MKILQIHNSYQMPGGEDTVALAEAEMLRRNGHEVIEFKARNAGLDSLVSSGVEKWTDQAFSLMFSREAYKEVRAICERTRPDIAHVHNFWMRLSPAVHSACHNAGVPTVQSLHNFRLLCPNGLLLRDGRVCEDCVGRWVWRGVVRRCYRGELVASAAVAAMVTFNRYRSTWDRDVDLFIALTEFSRLKFIEGGLPAEKIRVKANFIQDSCNVGTAPSLSNCVLFVGRLAPEKGLHVLLDAWLSKAADVPGRLVIVGDGPERASLEEKAKAAGAAGAQVAFVGLKTHNEVLQLMASVRAVVIPSVWYENFPMTLVEALMRGRPVLASDLGSLRELVPDRELGLRFSAGVAGDLGRALCTVLTDGALADRMGANARAAYLAHYSPEQNYRSLISIYDAALDGYHATRQATNSTI